MACVIRGGQGVPQRTDSRDGRVTVKGKVVSEDGGLTIEPGETRQGRWCVDLAVEDGGVANSHLRLQPASKICCGGTVRNLACADRVTKRKTRHDG